MPDLTTGAKVDNHEMKLSRRRKGIEQSFWATVSTGHEMSLAYYSLWRDIEAWSLDMFG